MKALNHFSVLVLALLALSLSLIVTTHAQEEDDDVVLAILGSFLKKSEYVHKVMFQLLGYKMLSYPGGNPIPEPMRFDNFTFDHLFGNWFQEGVSNTYNPLLHGFSASTFTIHPVVNTTYGVRIHLFIPVANLTGTYDLDVTEYGFFTPNHHYTGAGTYNHVFHDVHLWIDLTVGSTVDGRRTVAQDIHSTLQFSRCNLWAENFMTDGILWTDSKWVSQSARYKVNYEAKAEETDLLLSESVDSYLAMFWGMLKLNPEQAYQGLIQSGEQPVTRKPVRG